MSPECRDERRQAIEQFEDSESEGHQGEKSTTSSSEQKFPRFEIPKEQFMGNSIARDGTEVGSNSPKRSEKRGNPSSAVEASADGAGSARVAQRQVR